MTILMGIAPPPLPPLDAMCPLPGNYTHFFDHNLANWAIDSIHYALGQQRPFAIFAGFRRPHLPWRMPLDFWNKYAEVEVAAPKHPGVVSGLPDVAFTCGDNCSWTLWNDTSLPHCGLCDGQ